MNRTRCRPIGVGLAIIAGTLSLPVQHGRAADGAAGPAGGEERSEAIWQQIAPFFQPPAEFAGDFGDYRSPLVFDDGRPVKDAAGWQRRRQEILEDWQEMLG
ncbi:MAG: hypothetical protein ACREJB_18635, partial [Planctomycetaceae bacterium]